MDPDDDPDDVLTALLCSPTLSAEECKREAEASALSGVRAVRRDRTEWTDPDAEEE